LFAVAFLPRRRFFAFAFFRLRFYAFAMLFRRHDAAAADSDTLMLLIRYAIYFDALMLFTLC